MVADDRDSDAVARRWMMSPGRAIEGENKLPDVKDTEVKVGGVRSTM